MHVFDKVQNYVLPPKNVKLIILTPSGSICLIRYSAAQNAINISDR